MLWLISPFSVILVLYPHLTSKSDTSFVTCEISGFNGQTSQPTGTHYHTPLRGQETSQYGSILLIRYIVPRYAPVPDIQEEDETSRK